jgi:hypothetical protein
MNVRETNLVALDRLYRPEVASTRNQLTEKDDPDLRCAPYGYSRGIMSGPKVTCRRGDKSMRSRLV